MEAEEGARSLTAPNGRTLELNTEWKNPSGKWHVGLKRAFDLFTTTLINRLKKERVKVRAQWVSNRNRLMVV